MNNPIDYMSYLAAKHAKIAQVTACNTKAIVF